MQKIHRSEKEKRKAAEKQLKYTAYELGRYKKKVQDQRKELEQLREQIGGYLQAINLSHAMVTAAVEKAGDITFSKEDMSRILDSENFAVGSYNEEEGTYTVGIREVKSNGTAAC